jgi:hypothetical protein
MHIYNPTAFDVLKLFTRLGLGGIVFNSWFEVRNADNDSKIQGVQILTIRYSVNSFGVFGETLYKIQPFEKHYYVYIHNVLLKTPFKIFTIERTSPCKDLFQSQQ